MVREKHMVREVKHMVRDSYKSILKVILSLGIFHSYYIYFSCLLLYYRSKSLYGSMYGRIIITLQRKIYYEATKTIWYMIHRAGEPEYHIPMYTTFISKFILY